jgi:hypothetical protein
VSGEGEAGDHVAANADTDTYQTEEELDEIFSTRSFTQIQPALQHDFKPWHKPRKHLIREEQWGREVEWIIGRKDPDDKSLRYLGLPGVDLLDIRYLYERFCKDGAHELRFLGFEKSARPTSPYSSALNLSLQEVRSLEHIDRQSEILGDDLRLLADDNSIAWSTAQRLGPFDAINIDLTDHMARDEPAIDLSIYNVIHQVCGLQQRRPVPWTLFLTSRLDKANVSAEAFSRFLTGLIRNVEGCAAFRSTLQAQLGISEVSRTAAEAWDDGVFFNSMAVAFAKWLLGLAQTMRSVFSISSTIGYRVWAEAPYFDMLSIVLRFQPAPSIPPDSLGLASATPAFPDECSEAAKLPERVAQLVDIDEELKTNDLLWEIFREKAASLLSQARYDPTEYRAWADKRRNLPDSHPGRPGAPNSV